MSHPLSSKIHFANATLFERGTLAAVNDFFTPDYRIHLTSQDMTGGHDLVRKALTLYRSAFPDLRIEIEILVEAGDRVAWQRTIRATHTGDFRGFPATGRSMVWREMVASRFQDGLIAEEWLVSDLAEQLLTARKR
ncbi:MAG: ester cyclase [Chloroflexota bacterium]